MRLFRKEISILLIIAFFAVLLCACGETQTPPEQIQLGGVNEPESEQPALPPEETPAPAPAAETPSVPETADAVPDAQSAPAEETRAERVTDEWFADAAFFGNSLLDGLHSFGDLSCGEFFAGTSASVLSVETTMDARRSDGSAATLLDALLEKQYRKIYVLLGINELGFTVEGFVSLYGELLDTIAAAEPDAELFVMSLTPITEQRSNSEDLFTREKVLKFNEAIRAMTEEKGYTYLNLYTPLADESGWLSPEESTDGVHFTPEKYLEWSELMRVNYDGRAPGAMFQN